MVLLQLCSLLLFSSSAVGFRVVHSRDAVNATESQTASNDGLYLRENVLSDRRRRRRRRRRNSDSPPRRRGSGDGPSRRRGSGGGADPDGENDRVVTKMSPPGAQVSWVTQGNLVDTKADEVAVRTGAASEDYEVVFLGVSSGSDGTDKPQDGDFIGKQGFTLVGAEGTDDKKIEMWIRKNEGRGEITVCKPCGLWRPSSIKAGGKGCGWGVMTIGGSSLDIGGIKTERWSGGHKNGFKLRHASSRTGLNILAVLFDDSVEIRNPEGGDVALVKWLFGDGDGIGVVAWQPGKSMPSSVPVVRYDGGNSEFAAMVANIEVE